MILIFFDLGTVCIIIFFMAFVGAATAAELGSWVHEHFAWVVIAILIFSLCKSLIMQNKIKMPFSNKFICSIADTIRLVPATLFLQDILADISDLGSLGVFDFIFGLMGLVVGVCIVMLPMMILVCGTEAICLSMIEKMDSFENLGKYILVSIVGAGIQLVVLKLFGIV